MPIPHPIHNKTLKALYRATYLLRLQAIELDDRKAMFEATKLLKRLAVAVEDRGIGKMRWWW